MRRLYWVAALVVMAALLIYLSGFWRALLAPLGVVAALLSVTLGALGADRQAKRHGRPRRGGLGGNTTEGGGSSAKEASHQADGSGADRPPRSRPRRSGF